MNETYEQAAKFLQSVFEKSGLELDVSLEGDAVQCVLNLKGRDAELMQAEGADGLEAIQHLVNQAFGRSLPRGERIVCDVLGFRATRDAELRAMALHAANQVRSNGQPFTFGPMNSTERRVLHLTLADSEDLQTESIGEAADRRLKVSLKTPAR
ncbi:MAG: R3H domain-containing nucleic acid-binding protein [bacterium]